MTEQFKTTAEYRHWMARHSMEDLFVHAPYSLPLEIRDLLPREERAHWDRVCNEYDARRLPDWFIKEVGELYDY